MLQESPILRRFSETPYYVPEFPTTQKEDASPLVCGNHDGRRDQNVFRSGKLPGGSTKEEEGDRSFRKPLRRSSRIGNPRFRAESHKRMKPFGRARSTTCKASILRRYGRRSMFTNRRNTKAISKKFQLADIIFPAAKKGGLVL